LPATAASSSQFRREELLPIASRIRVRLSLDSLTPKELLDWLHHVLDQAFPWASFMIYTGREPAAAPVDSIRNASPISATIP